ncbi:MAG TPA: hypothetical protein VEZ20_04630 [Allosphingosinicella sp.]|nr:hypothetical protein [Allosphingosinicella sp.]
MYKALIAAALAVSASAGHGQIQAEAQPQELGPVIQDVPGRWIWRLRADSVVRVNVPGIGANVHEFWIVGENRGTTGARYAHARIGMDCASRRAVRERLVALDAARNVISSSVVGDHPSNWMPFGPGTSVDGARLLLCPAA